MTAEDFEESYGLSFMDAWLMVKDFPLTADKVKAQMKRLDVEFIAMIIQLETMMAMEQYYLKAATIRDFMIGLQISTELDDNIKIEE